MATITFITQQNETIITEATSGTVMELAVANNVRGIDGDCGGVCSCATCHVHVSPEHFDKLTVASAVETDLLEFEDETNAYSRLGCQMQINEAMDGMVLHVAN